VTRDDRSVALLAVDADDDADIAVSPPSRAPSPSPARNGISGSYEPLPTAVLIFKRVKWMYASVLNRKN